jgi:hypothetical protein
MYVEEKRWGEPQVTYEQELLLKAAAIIERQGWCQGRLGLKGEVCAVGALNMAHHGHPYWLGGGTSDSNDMVVHFLICKVLDKLGVAHVGLMCAEVVALGLMCVEVVALAKVVALARWNDAAGRTQGEVTAALREAAR